MLELSDHPYDPQTVVRKATLSFVNDMFLGRPIGDCINDVITDGYQYGSLNPGGFLDDLKGSNHDNTTEIFDYAALRFFDVFNADCTLGDYITEIFFFSAALGKREANK